MKNFAGIVPSAEHLWRCFGATRLLFASNWPCCDRVAGFDACVADFHALIAHVQASPAQIGVLQAMSTASTTGPGDRLLPEDPGAGFQGTIGRTLHESTPWWAPRQGKSVSRQRVPDTEPGSRDKRPPTDTTGRILLA